MNALILHTSLPSFKTYGELRAPSPKPPRCDRSSKDATAISLSGLRRAAPAAVWLPSFLVWYRVDIRINLDFATVMIRSCESYYRCYSEDYSN